MLRTLTTQELPVANDLRQVDQQFNRMLKTKLPGFVIQSCDEEAQNTNWSLLESFVMAAGHEFDSTPVAIDIVDEDADFPHLHVDGFNQKNRSPIVNVHQTTVGEADVTLLVPGFRNRRTFYGLVGSEDMSAFALSKVNSGYWQRRGYETTVDPNRTLVFKAGNRSGAAHHFATTHYPRHSVVRQIILN